MSDLPGTPLVIDFDDLDAHGCKALQKLLDAVTAEGLTPSFTEFRQTGKPWVTSAHYGRVKMLGNAGVLVEDDDRGPVAFLFHIDFDTKAPIGDLGFGPESLLVAGGDDTFDHKVWRPVFNRIERRWSAR